MSVYTTDLKPNGGDKYHTNRDCSHLKDAAQVLRVDVEDLPETHRECDRCKYAWVPTL